MMKYLYIIVVPILIFNSAVSYSTELSGGDKSFAEKACNNGSASSCIKWMNEEGKKNNSKTAWKALQAACHNGHTLACEQEEKQKAQEKRLDRECSDKKASSCVSVADLKYSIGESDWAIYYLEKACQLGDKKACDVEIQMQTLNEERQAHAELKAKEIQMRIEKQKQIKTTNSLILMNQLFQPSQHGGPAKRKGTRCSTRPIIDVFGKLVRYETDCR